VKYGNVPPEDALGFVTSNAAKQLGIDRRVGSLEPGKDADFVLWTGDPLSVYSIVEQTWVDGRLEFDLVSDREQREAIEKERAERIERVKRGDAAPSKTPAVGSEPAPPASPSQPARTTPPSRRPRPYTDPLAARGAAVSIVHATVHTVGGGTIADGTVSFRAGRIVEVGPGLLPLPGATVVDASGKHVYPGLIDADTSVGLVEIGSVAGSVDLAEIGEINPQIDTAISVNPDSEVIPVTRANGLTHVLAAPEGGLISGMSTLIRLDGWTWEDLAAARTVALHVRWPSFRIRRSSSSGPPTASEEDQKKQRDEAIERIKRTFEDARAYARAKEAQERGGKPVDVDPALEAMLPVLDGTIPVIVHASEIRQIRSALTWGIGEKLRLVLDGSDDVWRASDLLRENGVPVILRSVLDLPPREDSPYDEAYRIAATLHEAGVEFCIAGGGGASNSRNLPYHAAMAAAFGLPREKALEAVTIGPARILGIDRDLGSIEPGKSASLIVTDGDPLEIRTHVLAQWIDGRPVAIDDNKHERLYRRYSARPHASAGPAVSR
jgi:imidazolonepropionase-like amidohydrolase